MGKQMKGVLGEKLGMTQVWDENSKLVPVTVVKAGPCVVVQRKTVTSDGYEAVQIGLVESKPVKNVNRPMKGHFDKAGVPPTKILREVRVDSASGDAKVGDKVLADQFSENDMIDIIGTSKGRGFAGFVKRHNFAGGRASHGSMFHRAPGSIGSSAYPSRVIKGVRMAGHMGVDRKTVKNLRIVRVDAEQNIIMIHGSVPGPDGGYLLIKKSRR